MNHYSISMASFASVPLKRQGGVSGFVQEQEAEGTLVSNLEERRAIARKSDGWDAAVDGEVPPLERVPVADSAFFPVSQVAKGVPDMFNTIARQFNISKGVKAFKRTGTLTFTRKTPSVKDLVDGRKDGKPDMFTSFRAEKADAKFVSHVDNLVESAIKVNQMFEKDPYAKSDAGDTYDDTQSHAYVFARDNTAEPLLPVTSPGADPYSYSYGSAGSATGRKRNKKKKRAIENGSISQFWCLPRSRFGLAEVINPVACVRGLVRFLVASTFPFVILPAVLSAALLYYKLGNPSLEFLPGDASLSWWLLFIARQAAVLELVAVVEYLAVEGIALRTKWMVYSCGPLVTLWFINAKGWPLITILWSLLDLGLLHGKHPLQQNWLFFLDIGLFSSSNPGGHILNSDFYLRVLLSALLAGTCHAIKRTHVAMSFGRRTFLTYKSTLEQILADIVLITEVAELSTELLFVDGEHPVASARRVVGTWKHTLDVNYESTCEEKDVFDVVGGFGELNRDPDAHDADDSLASVDDDSHLDSSGGASKNDDNDGDEEDEDEDDESSEGCELVGADGHQKGKRNISSTAAVPSVDCKMDTPTMSTQPGALRWSGQFAGVTDTSVYSTDSTIKLKRLLDRWQEPQNKLDKPADISIAEILKFRKALTYMDDPLLFGPAFGICATRDQVIKSARKTYRRLLRSTSLSILSYDIIRLLALDEEGNLIEAKAKALKRLFRPDNRRELTLLAFVQTCDSVYKRLRFFRASVGNASVINKVLESIVDGLVNFLLALVIMTILQYNPYPVLVSLSTLMVSFAFAVGSSASKYIEVSS